MLPTTRSGTSKATITDDMSATVRSRPER
jgi:hypothetical protein